MGDRYLVFGFVIDSQIPLPEAYPAPRSAPVDVTVRFGRAGDGFTADDAFDSARDKKTWWQSMMGENSTLFNCPSGLYDIKNGNEVTVQLYPDADMEIAKIYLLGSALGAVQVQRGRIPVHGGAILTSNGAMIITGRQGAGKSTMTSAFVHNGYKYLTDDVSSVSIEGDKAHVYPAYPQRKLVRDACAPLGYDPNDLILVDGNRDKLAVRDKENWAGGPAKLWAVAELYPAPDSAVVSATLITGHEKLDYIARNIYRMWMHTPGGAIKPEVFKKILTVAAGAQIFKVAVPRDIERITNIASDIAVALEI